jgi:hypothetical protein
MGAHDWNAADSSASPPIPDHALPRPLPPLAWAAHMSCAEQLGVPSTSTMLTYSACSFWACARTSRSMSARAAEAVVHVTASHAGAASAARASTAAREGGIASRPFCLAAALSVRLATCTKILTAKRLSL